MDKSKNSYNLAKLLTNRFYLFQERSEGQSEKAMDQNRNRREVLSASSKFVIDRFWQLSAQRLLNLNKDLYFVDINQGPTNAEQRHDVKVSYSKTDSQLLTQILKKDVHLGFWLVRDFYYNAISKVLFDVFDEMNLLTADDELQQHIKIIEADVKNIDVYHKLDTDKTVVAFMTQGPKITANISFDLFRSAPLLFFNRHHRLPTFDEWKTLVLNTKPLVLTISSMHHGLLTDLKRLMNSPEFFHERAPKGIKADDFVFPKACFELADDSQSLTLNKQVMLEWRRRIENNGLPETNRLGCPARKLNYTDPKDSSEHDLIFTLIDKGLDFMLHYCFASLNSYVEYSLNAQKILKP
jgi:hypothetical protein